MTGLGSVAEQNLGTGSDYLAKNKQKKKVFCRIYRVSQKNACSWFYGNNSTLERARKKSRVVFEIFRKLSM